MRLFLVAVEEVRRFGQGLRLLEHLGFRAEGRVGLARFGQFLDFQRLRQGLDRQLAVQAAGAERASEGLQCGPCW